MEKATKTRLYVSYLFLLHVLSSVSMKYTNTFSGNASCSSNVANKIPLHIRSIMTFETEIQSGEFAVMLQAAADHINNMEGILDDYHICFRWDYAEVGFY